LFPKNNIDEVHHMCEAERWRLLKR